MDSELLLNGFVKSQDYVMTHEPDMKLTFQGPMEFYWHSALGFCLSLQDLAKLSGCHRASGPQGLPHTPGPSQKHLPDLYRATHLVSPASKGKGKRTGQTSRCELPTGRKQRQREKFAGPEASRREDAEGEARVSGPTWVWAGPALRRGGQTSVAHGDTLMPGAPGYASWEQMVAAGLHMGTGIWVKPHLHPSRPLGRTRQPTQDAHLFLGAWSLGSLGTGDPCATLGRGQGCKEPNSIIPMRDEGRARVLGCTLQG